MGLSGVLRLILAAAGLAGVSTISITLGQAQSDGWGLEAVGRSLFLNSVYVLAALAWSMAAFLALDRWGGLRGVNTRDQLERGNLAGAVVVAANLLGVFFISAWSFR